MNELKSVFLNTLGPALAHFFLELNYNIKVSPRKFVYIYYMIRNRKSIHIFWDSLNFIAISNYKVSFVKNISSLQETLFMRSLWHPEIQRQTNHSLTPYLCLKLNTSLTSHLDSVAMLTEPESECRNSLDGRSKSTQQLLANTWPLNNFKTENCLNSSVKTFIRDS